MNSPHLLLSEDIDLEDYKVVKMKINRGTIYLNDEYYINDHMITSRRRESMEILYKLKPPFSLSKRGKLIDLENRDTLVTLTLTYLQ